MDGAREKSIRNETMLILLKYSESCYIRQHIFPEKVARLREWDYDETGQEEGIGVFSVVLCSFSYFPWGSGLWPRHVEDRL
jgi:hypothetical protein